MFIKQRNLEDGSKSKYLDTALRLISNFNKKFKGNENSWEDFISWFDSQKSKWSEATWRNYKASVAYYLKTQEMPEHANTVEKLSNLGALKKTNKSTGNKKKSLTAHEEDTIRNKLSNMANSKDEADVGRDLLAYFECILSVGVRPIEIHTMQLIQERPVEFEGDCYGPYLKVKNGKATNGRSFGPYRYIGLGNLSAKTIMMIEYAIATAKSPTGRNGEVLTYSEFYYNLSRKYGRIIKSIWPSKKQLITLYTCRHQCIANMKNSGYLAVEIAVIVGHGNDLTACEHYGKRRSGKDVILPSPNKLDIPKISKKLELKLMKYKKVSFTKPKPKSEKPFKA